MSRFKYNRDQLKFTEEKPTFGKRFRRVLNVLFSVVLCVIAFYMLFSLFFNTEEEKRLLQEKRALEREYQRIEEKSKLLDAVVDNLGERDRHIYGDIFDANPPGVLFDNRFEIEYSEDISLLGELSELSRDKVLKTERKVEDVKDMMSKIIDIIRDSTYNYKPIPLISPIRNIAISQAGASIGDKIHPFYKTKIQHTGLDIISVVGTNVVATADGVIQSVVRSDVQKGNYIEIDHGEGYITRYMHLSDMFVRRNQKIKRGDIIALVGVTGLSFAPHLHYEVEFNGKIMNPVDYMFAQLNARDYVSMMLITFNTGQSLD